MTNRFWEDGIMIYRLFAVDRYLSAATPFNKFHRTICLDVNRSFGCPVVSGQVTYLWLCKRRNRIWNPRTCEPPHDKTNKMTCAPSEGSDQPGHLPGLIRVFAVRMKKGWVLSYPMNAKWRLIRLGGCPGWSETSLCAQIMLLVLSRGGSYVWMIRMSLSGSWGFLPTRDSKSKWIFGSRTDLAKVFKSFKQLLKPLQITVWPSAKVCPENV